MTRRYTVYDWKNQPHRMTAGELYARVMADSRASNYGWIAPARELMRICKKRSFPENLAVEIKLAILDCFANIADCRDHGHTYHSDKDDEAVEYCYNSLAESSSVRVNLTRYRFLKSAIDLATRRDECTFLFFGHGPAAQKFHKEWVENKVSEYCHTPTLEFRYLITIWAEQFEGEMRSARRRGDFDSDDEAERRFWGSIVRASSPLTTRECGF